MILRRVSTRAAGATRSGFTLAELLAVVAILAILAGVAIPSSMAIVNNSKLRVARSDCNRYAGMLKTWSMEQGDQFQPLGYPAQEGDMSLLVSAGYLTQPPVTPWGNDTYYYTLAQSPNGTYEPIVYCTASDGSRVDSTQR
jgi:prepilin-type N-terminal cleavage/methylation domain-containing protein